MGVVQTLAMLLGLSSATALFFDRSNTVANANGQPIDEQCIAHGEAGNCEFYDCFEQRLSCGASGYMKKFGTPYCDRFQRSLSTFTPQGQAFVNGSSQCLTKALLPYYRQDQVDCHRLSHEAFDVVSSCYASNGFCVVLKDNAPVFMDIYQPKHLFQSGALKIWREILEVTYKCDPERYHSFANTAFNLLSKAVNYFTSF
ncbi:uncharacterized protein [Littorina saxatilis]|uniref:Stanniocalcin-like protein n=1 Tax=Littorina saxatilis TaxID=31220 RepID=A0AAN9G6Q1_9CAEN